MLLCGAAQAETLELVALGDSLTQGYGLPQGEGFVPTLQGWLDDQGRDVQVVNAGVSGDTTAGGLSRVEWSLSDETDAMIVALGGNDLLRGISPETARANLDGILDVAEDRGLPVLLVGMIAPSNYGPDYKAAFDALYVELSEKYGTLFYPEFFAGLRDAEGDTPSDMARFMQPDGIHPSADGVERIVQDMGPSVAELLDRAARDE
ncbi:acyl-CoA thioesterase-1 [Roseivivax lentus]|uniref:Acyl-CoA thioesterase-1 n=1 Tax=Roseivivax lentus TaxID=633194 RepID=A0A1N7L628_9RHOB|nr:arylesterase [Roseivivax lentus]SIS69325.1 acyl-CoA thioesterase-1 [Roseivivax lentus]